MGAEEIAPLFRGVDCALFLFGHVHYQQDRWVGGVHLVNPGSVSLTNHGDGLARYAILEARASGITVHLRAVAYDVEVVAQDCFAVGHPIAPTIAKRLRRGW
jgi:predicted phosphodiesterase